MCASPTLQGETLLWDQRWFPLERVKEGFGLHENPLQRLSFLAVAYTALMKLHYSNYSALQFKVQKSLFFLFPSLPRLWAFLAAAWGLCREFAVQRLICAGGVLPCLTKAWFI